MNLAFFVRAPKKFIKAHFNSLFIDIREVDKFSHTRPNRRGFMSLVNEYIQGTVYPHILILFYLGSFAKRIGKSRPQIWISLRMFHTRECSRKKENT